ncbi:peptidoglycan-binding domain-containing protein [Tabrizicola sp. YIM 78059]|uniref:peptidoglycan-binding domain-containing protein n=1 Tax=Tabrizicola sp. YIM 78059 TaxID=2529861 RepID=UPI0010AB3FB0|nr:peptidoglycan-binding domain-containing protein [Tabrizicola sp. YIM 78059]
MKIRAIATSALMASLAMSPLSPVSAPARADSGDFIAGAIIGGIIGSAVTNENNKKKAAKSTKAGTAKAKAPSISAEQRAANKEVQVALNYFGYPVGTPDGAIGPKSRAAIKEYQAFLGYPATGELTEHERTILITAYHRAVAGGPLVAQAVAGSMHGLKAVLIAQQDEMAGLPPGGIMPAAPGDPVQGSVAAAAAAALPKLVPEAPPAEEVAVEVATQPEPGALVAEAAPELPSFMGSAAAKGSLAAECGAISLKTASNGRMTTVEGMQDANFALAEQFCLARGYAMATSDELAAQIAGFTSNQIAQQCAAFGPVLKEHVAAVSLKPADEVLKGVETFVLSSGMTPAQLAGTARVCLGMGYARDEMDVAIGSALLLAAMGERGYAEYLGHHLSQGFGATRRPDLAMDWYQLSLDAMGQGQMVVAPGIGGRDALIRKAAYTINGRAAELQPAMPAPNVQEAALPVFDIVPEPALVVEEAVVAPEPEPVAPAADLVSAGGATVPPDPVVLPEPSSVVPAGPPVFVAPKVADLRIGTPAARPEPSAAASDEAGILAVGAQAAITAARLPLLIFSSF